MSKAKDGIKIEGFCRIQLLKNGKVESDSGWQGPNQITNEGFRNYLCRLLGGDGASKDVQYMAIGTGGDPGAAAVTLPGEIMGSTKRKAVTFSTVNSTTAQFTASWASTDITAVYTINNAGLYQETTTDDQLFCGKSYSQSDWSTDQDLNATYQIRFS